MHIHELDTVVLEVDLADYGLKKGDIGAVVELDSPKAAEVEFVSASGRTRAILTLELRQVRPVGPNDIPAVRELDAA